LAVLSLAPAFAQSEKPIPLALPSFDLGTLPGLPPVDIAVLQQNLLADPTIPTLTQEPLEIIAPEKAALAVATAEPESQEPQEGEGVPYRIRKPQDLFHPVIRDPLVRVPGAKVAYHNRAALERDFPFVKKLSDQGLEDWILDEFAFISKAQHALNDIRNSPIPVPEKLRAKENRKIGYRPLGYGRAAVLPVHDPRASSRPVLVDVKGIGHHIKAWEAVNEQISDFKNATTQADIDNIHIEDHSDGLMSLGEAIAELTRQQAAQKLFEEHNAKHNTSLQTVDTYFIIALPFSILKAAGQELQAALYGRQAHMGRSNGYDVPTNIYTDHRGDRQSDWLHSAAVDFGAVLIKDPRLQGNFGSDDQAPDDPQRSKAWRYAHEVADAFSRTYNPDLSAIERHLKEMLKPLLSTTSFTPRPNRIMEFNERIKRDLKDPEPEIRLIAAKALQGRSDADSFALTEYALLKDTNTYVRAAAAKALKGRSNVGVLALIEYALKDSESRVRGEAVKALQGRSDAGSFALIEYALLKDTSTYVRGVAAHVLQGRSDAGVLALIELALKDTNPQVRLIATEALKGRSDIDSLALIELASKDTDPQVRKVAAYALIKNKSLGYISPRSARLSANPLYRKG
jgi:hypothetical protein